ncbi:unnamed protein product [Vitrella brassicaformis CCMP3155]|uniref:Serine aminopeptidase S33 domain-containing protein n=2 Tax=Vitrella brassicaformis TaxID=1169539 RepID=A0A0G4EL17_VITBC|nr:unnamed protein product [Vitrella brassicaformis CCMP3155]|eukprot:CEL97684.1 unnamed protein product [Vitrella brassicaformis CCMP3155]
MPDSVPGNALTSLPEDKVVVPVDRCDTESTGDGHTNGSSQSGGTSSPDLIDDEDDGWVVVSETFDDPYDADGSPRMSTFINARGLRIQTYAWEVCHPRGVICAVHGYSSHARLDWLVPPACDYEGSWVQRLNQRGYSFVALDIQGFGRSQGWRGLRGCYQRFDHVVDDVLHVIRSIKKQHASQLPTFVMGCSLGGNLALRAAHQAQKEEMDIAGVILLAPMLSVDNLKKTAVRRAMLLVAPLLSALFPTAACLAIPRGKDPRIDEVFDNDPYTYKKPLRLRVAKEQMNACDKAQAIAPSVRLPMLLFHSRNDTFIEAAGSQRLWEASPSEDKTLLWCDHMWHHLMTDAGNLELLATIAKWLDHRSEPTTDASKWHSMSTQDTPEDPCCPAAVVSEDNTPNAPLPAHGDASRYVLPPSLPCSPSAVTIR